VSQRLSLQTVDAIGTAAVWVLAKPPFVLMQRKRHCRLREARAKTDRPALRNLTKGATGCQAGFCTWHRRLLPTSRTVSLNCPPGNSGALNRFVMQPWVRWDKFVAQLFALPFEFFFQPFISLGVSGVPDGLVIFTWFLTMV
jgi:hypothetical protein